MKKSNTKLLMGTAVAGLLAAGTMSFNKMAHAEEGSTEAPKGHCNGANACKGKGACKGAKHACAGKNACKGKGFMEMTEAECKAAKGKWEAPKA